jgi:tRNA(Ile)-lysidine synthase
LNHYSLSIDHILQVLEKLPAPGHYWLAYSGGMDSTALLSILATHRDRLLAELVAVHVNHQLSANADQWEKHCRAFCREINIRYESVTINVRDGRTDSPEAHARELRYAALEQFMQQDDILLTAHHRNDLAETVIQQLLRGSGPEGLSAIPDTRRCGRGWLARPLLAYSRRQIEEYVRGQRLTWVEDESNIDQGLDRNFIRNTVMPTLRERWPSTADVLWRVSRVQADAVVVLNDMAEQDLHGALGNSDTVLRLSAVDKLSLPRQRNLLRYWIRKNGHPVPAMNVIDEIINELMHARPDSMPCVRWGDTEVRRYRDEVSIMPATTLALSARGPYLWSLEKSLELDGGRLAASMIVGSGIRADRVQDNKVEIRFREGGESIRPAGRKETHELKKLFQDSAVPPWKRDRIPLVYVGDELAAVAGYWVADGFQATGSEQGWEIVYTEKARITIVSH